MGEIIKSAAAPTYLHDYDDPYKLLAAAIESKYDPQTVIRVLQDDEFVLRLVRKEIRQQDIRGPFSDCIIQTILDDKRRMVLMHELDKLSEFLFYNLDLDRLRQEILNFCEDCYN